MELAAAHISPEREQWLANERHVLRCHVELSALYHKKRERFLVLCERLAQALAAVTSTAAFAQVVGSTTVNQSFMLLAAVGSVLPLVFAWSSRSNKHATLASAHKNLLRDLIATGHDTTEQQLVRFQTTLADIETGEGASLGALVVHCQNEMAIAQGHQKSVVSLSRPQYLLMHVIDFQIKKPQVQDEPAASACAPSATT